MGGKESGHQITGQNEYGKMNNLMKVHHIFGFVGLN